MEKKSTFIKKTANTISIDLERENQIMLVNKLLSLYLSFTCGCAHLPQKLEPVGKYKQIKCKSPPRGRREEIDHFNQTTCTYTYVHTSNKMLSIRMHASLKCNPTLNLNVNLNTRSKQEKGLQEPGK